MFSVIAHKAANSSLSEVHTYTCLSLFYCNTAAATQERLKSIALQLARQEKL